MYDNYQLLKVAHNANGMKQNEAEADLLDDGYLQQTGIIIPLIDYDGDHTPPLWIHTEHAQKATEKQLCELMKCPSLRDLVYSSMYAFSGQSPYGNLLPAAQEKVIKKWGEDAVDTFLEYVDLLQELQQFDLEVGDFARAANWGIYQGRPVVIDLGYTQQVKSGYHR